MATKFNWRVGQQWVIAGLLLLANTGSALGQANFSEGFDNVGQTNGDGPQNLINQGWIFRNQSAPRGTKSWFDGYTPSTGVPYWPQPQDGAGYLAVTSDSTDFFGGTVSNWAILPTIAGQQAGDELRFYLYDLGGSNVNTLQVRYSAGGGTNTGSGSGAVGDFTQLLLDINPIPEGGWNLYSVTLPGTGRIALRYYIASACNFACFSSYTGIDSLSIGVPPPPPCNLPPAPAAGQTVTWTAAGSPYHVCQNIGIPPDSTVIVEPGVEVHFDAGMQLQAGGTLRLEGTVGGRIVFNHPAVFPPMIEVNGGTVDAAFGDIGGQLRVNSGANVSLVDCGFAGNGLLWVQELPSVRPFLHLQRCTFDSTLASISDALTVLEDNTFINTTPSILRGYADVTAKNTFVGGHLWVTREESVQPLLVDGVDATGSPIAGIVLEGGDYFLGPNTALQGNLYPVALGGGLLPGSAVPTSGNTINAIDAGSGGFMGRGRWSNLGLPYRLTEPTSSSPGGHLTIDPGVVVEAANPNAAMWFNSTRHGVFDGLPDAPIIFRGLSGQPWQGLLFWVNSTTGCRMEYCAIENAEFGVISTDNTLYVDNCVFTDNELGANTNTFGTIFFRKTRFVSNYVGVAFTDQGSMYLNSPGNSNSFEGNTFGAHAFEVGSSADARNCWWNDSSGPQAPGNPAGQGDSIVGVGATGVQYAQFLTAPPDFANTPPVVRMVEPGLTHRYASPDYTHPDFLLDQGTQYVLHWDVQSDDTIVNQRIEFSPDGHFSSRFTVLVDDIPGAARAWEITVPNPDFAVTNQPQFLRVVAVDAAGQEAWDQVPLTVPSGRVTGNLNITTDLSGQTFFGGSVIPPDVQWTGSVSFGSVRPLVVLESDGAAVLGLNVSGQGYFFQNVPFVSTDRARLALQVTNNSNDVAWFFADGYFSIRHDPRMGFTPPSVTLSSPLGGESFPGGSTVPIAWTATAPEGLRSFDIQASYDAGRTWHPIVRDLPADATSYDWRLPGSGGIPDVRVRVIARDQRFQNSSDDVAVTITPGVPTIPGDIDGDGDVDGTDRVLFIGVLLGTNTNPDHAGRSDLNGDSAANGLDMAKFIDILLESKRWELD